MKFLICCLMALAAVQCVFSQGAKGRRIGGGSFGPAQHGIDLYLTQVNVKSYEFTPVQCYMEPYPCGNMTTLPAAERISKDWFNYPNPPFFSDKIPRSAQVIPVDYHMCNYTRHEALWISFPWGQETTYIRVLNGFNFVNCQYGMCDEVVYFGGYKYGCVATWNTRTVMALWYRKEGRKATKTKCFNNWCFVNVRITYPEACKCAQLYPCVAPWDNK